MNQVAEKGVKVGDIWQYVDSLDCIKITAVGLKKVLYVDSSTGKEHFMMKDASCFQNHLYGRLIERDGKPIIPKPEKTLKERIEEEYPDFEVVMFGWRKLRDCEEWCIEDSITNRPHICCQSMRRFHKYVYKSTKSHLNGFITRYEPRYEGELPIGGLFERKK